MPLLNINDLRARLKNCSLSGWYLFAGEESYLSKIYSAELCKGIIEDEYLAPFNHVVYNSAEIDFAELREAIQSPPMMAEYKLIEWKNADLTALKEKELKFLKEEIFPLKHDYPEAVVSITAAENGFDFGTDKSPSRLMRTFGEVFDIIRLGKSTDAQLLSWLKRHFDSEGINVTLGALNAMLAKVGHSMELLNSEVKKLSHYLKANGRDTLDEESVALVCSGNLESDSFALQNAVQDGNARLALRALLELKSKRTEPQIVIGMLAKTYSALSAVSLLLEEGESAGSIGKLLGMRSYPLERNMQAAKKLGIKKINSALAELLRVDAASKHGGISGYQAIELFITQNI